jgi:putative CRISPR-associated protein (TIGR02620 family)
MRSVIVTRHPALVAYLRQQDIAPAGAEVVSHATPRDVEGAHVYGVLPLHLAALAAKLTVVGLALTADMRGRELSLDEVAAIAQPPVTYRVVKCQ